MESNCDKFACSHPAGWFGHQTHGEYSVYSQWLASYNQDPYRFDGRLLAAATVDQAGPLLTLKVIELFQRPLITAL